jgi:hypothetical protein
MRRHLFLVCLLSSLGWHAAQAAAGDCRREILDAEHRTSLLDTIHRTTGQKADPDTLSACRSRGERHARVHTAHARSEDGTEHWHQASCRRRSGARSSWTCDVWEYRAFRAWPYPHEPGVWVAIDPHGTLRERRPIALRIFESIAGPGSLAECGDGAATHRSHSDLRRALTGGDGVVRLYADGSHPFLSKGALTLRIEDGRACWFEEHVEDVSSTASGR